MRFIEKRILSSILPLLVMSAMFSSLHLYADRVPLQVSHNDVPVVPIATLPQIAHENEMVWIKARVLQQTDIDTYLIEDISGQIILFLSTDELLNLDIKPNQEILVWGKIDISQIHPSKNEFYAERILLPRPTH